MKVGTKFYTLYADTVKILSGGEILFEEKTGL